MKQKCIDAKLTVSLFVLLGAGMSGCPPTTMEPPDTNQSPTANAGGNQTVETGSDVMLNGSGADPDGDSLQFNWTQTSGPNVNLSNPNAPQPTFTAPGEPGTVSFELTVMDGQGGADTDVVDVTIMADVPPPPPPPQEMTLFIANFDGNNVTSYDDPATVNGNIIPDINLAGAQTRLDDPADILVDAAGNLRVANFGTPSITGYSSAVSANGNLAPDRNVQGAATQLVQPASLAVRTASDLAFVADGGTDQIYVYAGASTAAFNGNLAPTRIISSGDLNSPTGINFGQSDALYVANNGDDDVLVFHNASSLNGDVAPNRVIESGVFNTVFDVFVDGNDTMYVVDPTAGAVFTFNNASTLNGTVAPDFTLDVIPGNQLTSIAVDSNGTGYLTDFLNDAVYSYDNIATLNGSLPPDRTIQGTQTQLVGPLRVFLLEP